MTPFKTVILFIFLSIIGILLIPRFSIDLNPSNSLPKLTISYSLPNASPEIVEQEATAPLENTFSQITNIKKIYSVSNQNNGIIEITFDRYVDLDFKKFEASSLIRQLYPRLHKQLSYPIIEQRGREDDSVEPLLLYQINSSLAPFQIQKVIEETFVPKLSQLAGVRDVTLSGAEGLQITIDYDYQKLKLYKLSPELIAKAIHEEFSSFYPGSFTTAAEQKLLIKGEHTFHDIAELQNLILPTTNQALRLKDIANVFVEESKPRQYFRINGLNSVTLAIYADEWINRLEVAANVRRSVFELSNNLPIGYALQLDYDDTEFLAKEIRKNYLRSGLTVFILVLFIIISYRNWKHLLVLFTGIIVNLSLTALGAYFLGVSIHLYTIAGITISFGMMVDNSIVMVDHLYHKNDSKIFRAILGATLTTVMALLLVLFLPEEERLNLTEFSIIVAIALSCSILVATFYIPAVYKLTFEWTSSKRKTLIIFSLRQKARLFSKYVQIISFVSLYKKTFITLLILAFGLPIFMLPSKWEEHAWYNKTVGSEFYQEKIRPYTDKILGGSLRLFIRNVLERSEYRNLQRTQLYVYASLPYGNTLDEMNRVMQNMESYLKDVEGIDKYVTKIRTGQDASITIFFDEVTERGSLPYLLKNKLIARSLDWSGVKWNIFGVGQGFSTNKLESLPNYKVEMRSYNYDGLTSQADILANKLLRNQRIQKVNTNERLSWNEKVSQHYVLDFNWQRAASLGVFPAQVADALHQKGDQDLSQLSLTDEAIHLPVFIKPNDGESFSAFEVMEGALLSENKNLKLINYATLRLDQTSSSIHKENRQYIRSIGFDYFGSYQFASSYLDEVLKQMEMELPVGYSIKKAAWGLDLEQVKKHYSLILVLIVGIFIICAILFENLKQPLYIIVTIPIAFIGIFLSFGIFNFYFDQGGYAAFVMLGGLAVNSAIFIINDFNNTPKFKNYNRYLLKAIAGKFRPIILTTLSTCLGLIPFLIGGENEIFWFALAVGTIGGLIFSLFSVIIVLPVLAYKRLSDFQDNRLEMLT